ncbi:MAG: DNA adenine methylase [Pirellulaceae bacterium]
MNVTRPSASTFNSSGPDAPVAWYGGKYYLARWIIEHLPTHRVYVEPFGGMANVLLKKQPSEVEVFNDLDGRVVNLFRVLRDRQQFEELKRLAELTPYSREQFAELCAMPEPATPIEKAFWFFVRCRQARGGIGMSNITANAWATSTRTRRSMPEPISKYLSALDGLDAVAERFRGVMVEAVPAIELIKKYDGPDVLFYCDPPYLGSTRHGGKAATYHVEMTDSDHELLLEQLRQCVGKVVLSGYPSPLYDRLLSGWQRIERPTKVQFSNSGGDRTEVLWQKP